MEIPYTVIKETLTNFQDKEQYSRGIAPYAFLTKEGKVCCDWAAPCYAGVRSDYQAGDLAFFVPSMLSKGEQAEAKKEFLKFILGPESPWSKHFSSLFPIDSLIVDGVDLFSEDYKMTQGLIFPTHVSLPKNLLLNFCKAYRSVAEHLRVSKSWAALVKKGLSKRQAYWFACHFIEYSVSSMETEWQRSMVFHSIFNYNPSEDFNRYRRITQMSPDETKFITPSPTTYASYPSDCIWDTPLSKMKKFPEILNVIKDRELLKFIQKLEKAIDDCR